MGPTWLAVVKIGIAVAAIALLWVEHRKLQRRFVAAWIALAVMSVLAHYRFSPERVLAKYSAYDLVHYYLNAKYFPELGYTRLYQACLVAKDERGGRRLRVSLMRDLYDQQLRGRPYADDVRAHPERIKQHFSPRRWRAFKRDIRELDKQLRPGLWRQIFIDRGYNATPTWHLVGRALTSAVPVSKAKLLCHLDTLLVLGMFLVIGWSHGRHVALPAVVFFFTTFSSSWPGVGASLLRYDWLAASLAGACLLGRGHRFWGGALIGWAALSRIFPAALLFFLFLRGAHRLIRDRSFDRDALRIAGGFVVVVAVGTGVTAGVLGTDHFDAFAHDLEVQLAPENLSVNRMGLAVALAYRGETAERELRRRERYVETGRMGPLRTALGLGFLVLAAISIWRPSGATRPARDDADLAQLGFLAFALLLTASFYYWTLRTLAVVLHARHRASSRWDTIGLTALFAIEIASYALEEGTGFRYCVTALTSIAVSLYAASVCVVRFRASGKHPSRT